MPDTAYRYRTRTEELVPETLASLRAFRELQEAASSLIARAEVLHREWAAARAEGHLCDWGQDPPDMPLDAELFEWIERVRALTEAPQPRAASTAEVVSRAADTDLGPAYFFG